MAFFIRRRVLCGTTNISTTTEGQVVKVVCLAGEATFTVDYGSAGDLAVGAQIEVTNRRKGPVRPQ